MKYGKSLNIYDEKEFEDMVLSDLISIGARCIAEIDCQFFLLVEIEIDLPGKDIQQVIIFRICPEQAEALMNAGIMPCNIVDEITKPKHGTTLSLLCVFVVGDNAYLVFNVENCVDKFLLVRVPLCIVVDNAL